MFTIEGGYAMTQEPISCLNAHLCYSFHIPYVLQSISRCITVLHIEYNGARLVPPWIAANFRSAHAHAMCFFDARIAERRFASAYATLDFFLFVHGVVDNGAGLKAWFTTSTPSWLP